MSGILFNYFLGSGESAEHILKWLAEESDKELLEISDGVTVSPSQFVCLFFSELRTQTQWMFKQEQQPESLKTQHKPGSAKKQSPCGYNNRTQTPTREKSLNSGEKLNLTSESEKKSRPRVKLFTSPRNGRDSPTRSPSFTSTPRQPDTPKSTNSSDSPSPLWTSADFPTTPLSGKVNSWNLGCENLGQSKQRSPNVHNKSGNDNLHCRSKVKLSLGDFVIKEAGSAKGKGRRIKPTMIKSEPVRALPVDSPFAASAFHPPEQTATSAAQDRLTMKMECDSVQKKITVLSSPKVKPESPLASPMPDVHVEKEVGNLSLSDSKNSSESSLCSAPTVAKLHADPEGVTNKLPLDKLSQIYSFMLCENLCDNIMIEFCFLATLIAGVDPGNNAPRYSPLDTIHNCTYFAIQSLGLLKGILSQLNSTTLAYLAGAAAVGKFAPDLHQFLNKASQEKLKKSSASIQVPQADGTVSFQCDTDNVENFTTHLNFTSFRKQRDGLYNLLQAWDQCHTTPGWSFQSKLSSKVKAVLAIREDPTNMVHLARLFRNQLLASCAINSATQDEAGEDVLELLPLADRGRLSRLQARLREPGTGRGPVPGPDFPGRQMFFKEFIRACGPGYFLHFLQLSLVDELLRLDEVDFASEGNDGFADELTRKRYLECVSSTRLLAKFLAFAEFLPYQGSEDFSDQIVNLHSAIRQKTRGLFDLEECVASAAASHRLVLTLPWVVSYLSLMDHGSAQLGAYRGVWCRLSALRRKLPPHLTPTGRLLLQLSLGWLFQVAPVPDKVSDDGRTALESRLDEERGLDELEVVSEAVLYHVCPFLCELNGVLSGSSSSSGRHIRPTPTTPKEDREGAAKRLELQLEESFLRNQSSSTKRAIQFVSERVTSCCIKEIAADLLPLIKIKTKDNVSKNASRMSLDEALASWEAEVADACWKAAREGGGSRVAQALTSILGRDVAEGAVRVAIDLATRQVIEKVQSWTQSHALADSARNEMEAFLATPLKQEAAAMAAGNGDAATLVTVCVTALRDGIWQAVHGMGSEANFASTVAVTTAMLNGHPLAPPTERGIFCLLVELLIWSNVNNPSVSRQMWNELAGLGARLVPAHPSSPLDRVLCSRNIALARGHDAALRLAQLPLLLVQVDLISSKNAAGQINSCLMLNLFEGFRQALLQTIDALKRL